MKSILAVVAILVGCSAAGPAPWFLEKRVDYYHCEYYDGGALGAIAERRCGFIFGVSIDPLTTRNDSGGLLTWAVYFRAVPVEANVSVVGENVNMKDNF